MGESIPCERIDTDFVGVKIQPPDQAWESAPGLPPDHPDYDVSQEYGPGQIIRVADLPCHTVQTLTNLIEIECDPPNEGDEVWLLTVETVGFPAAQLVLPENYLFEADAAQDEGPQIYRFYDIDGTTLIASAAPNLLRNFSQFEPTIALGNGLVAQPDLAFCMDSSSETPVWMPGDASLDAPCDVYMVTRFSDDTHDVLWDGELAQIEGYQIMGQARSSKDNQCIVYGSWSAFRL